MYTMMEWAIKQEIHKYVIYLNFFYKFQFTFSWNYVYEIAVLESVYTLGTEDV